MAPVHMGEEALRALLDPEGWSLRDVAIVAASERARGDPNAARAAVLDADLRAVGNPAFHDGRTGVLARRAPG